jgi:hypothetical protein
MHSQARPVPIESAYIPIHNADLRPGGGSMGHLIFEILMGFVSFGSVAILLASLVGIAAWILRQLIR